MSTGQWLVLALADVLAFWMVGAYNRLVAMRTALGEAMRQVDEWVQRRAATADTLAVQARLLLASETGALDAWLEAQSTARRATEALRQRPVRADLAAAVGMAETALAASSARVMALLEQQQAPLAPESAPTDTPMDTTAGMAASVPALVATLGEVHTRLTFARQVFNEAAHNYNAAVGELPTRWLARVYGFERAGQL